MSQLSAPQDSRQGDVEENLARLGRARALLEHDSIRVKQAIDREEDLDHLLEPVIIDVIDAIRHIQEVQKSLRKVWENGQQNHWGGD